MEERRSFCRICAAACGIVVQVDGDRVLGVRGDPTHPVSRGYTCPKGRALGAFHHRPDRIDRPRVDGVDVGWEEALDDLAARLAGLPPVTVGFYLATGFGFDSAAQLASMTWFAGLRSPQRYTAVTIDNAPVLVAADLVSGQPMLNPVWDPDQPGLLLALGINPVVSHGYGTAMPDPVSHLRRYRAAGGRVWVLDPRRTETAAHADRHLPLRPGADTAVLAWLCGEVLAGDVAPPPTVHPEDHAVLRAALEPFTLERAAAASGLPGEDLLALRDEVLANRGRLAVMCGTGLTMARDGVLAEWLRWVLLASTDSLDRRGGMRFNRGAVMRLSRSMRPAPPPPPPASRPELPTVIGQYPCVAMVDEIEAGNLRALVVGGGNPISAFPDRDRTIAALASLDVLAVVDVVDGELTRMATHVLPATAQLERADLTLAEHVSIRSGLQYTDAVVAPGGERRPAWWIFSQLARRGGRDILGGADPDALDDVAYLGGLLARSTLDPAHVVAAGPHGVDVPHEAGWVAREVLPEGRWRLAPPVLVERLRRHRRPAEGLVLVNRRDVRRLNSVRYAGAADAEPQVRLHPADGAARGLGDGDGARLRSDHGELPVRVHLDPGVRRGTVSVNHGRADADVAVLTSRVADVDPLTGMPRASALPVELLRG